jgi:hypothetical protein
MPLLAIGVLLSVAGILGLTQHWGSSNTRASSPAPVTENPGAFLAAFVQALRTGDETFLVQRLHPAVLARYGTEQCRRAVRELEDPNAELRLVRVSQSRFFTYASDGRTETVANTFTLATDGTVHGRRGTREYHVAVVDGRFRTFLDCGAPVSSP